MRRAPRPAPPRPAQQQQQQQQGRSALALFFGPTTLQSLGVHNFGQATQQCKMLARAEASCRLGTLRMYGGKSGQDIRQGGTRVSGQPEEEEEEEEEVAGQPARCLVCPGPLSLLTRVASNQSFLVAKSTGPVAP